MKGRALWLFVAAVSGPFMGLGSRNATVMGSPSEGQTMQKNQSPISGMHEFDFFLGSWRVRHRQLKERLVHSQEWIEFGGTTVAQSMLGGAGNVDDNFIDKPSGAYRAVTLRAYDSASGQWSIWWLDGQSPLAPLEPPMRGSFKNGVGTFYANDTLKGTPIRVRFLWTHDGNRVCHWEQAFSADGGLHWETNWVMDFERA